MTPPAFTLLLWTLLLAACAGLLGCESSSLQPSRLSGQFMAAQKRSGVELLLFGCENYRMNARGQWESTPCVPIEITDNPADVEAWQFERRVRLRGPSGSQWGGSRWISE